MATPTAPGITSLSQLIQSMSPKLDDTTYVFATVPNLTAMPFGIDEVTMLYNEGPSRGWTVIISQTLAARHQDQLKIAFPCKKITLEVQSSLDAIGFMATITARLARELSIGVNPVSGFYHDHLFVPLGKEGLVMEQLEAMTKETMID